MEPAISSFASEQRRVTKVGYDMYRSIAAATTFSPRFLAVLSEARNAAKYFKAPLQLIHVGDETEDKRAQILQGLKQLSLPRETTIHWVPGEPGEVICRVAREQHCELVVAGAVQQEAGYRPFANDIARKLLADGPFDLFLFLEPRENGHPFKKPAVIIDFTETSAEALRQVVKSAAAGGSEKVYALQVLTTFDEHRLRASGDDRDAEERLDQFILDSTELDVPVETAFIRGNTGFAACEYLQSIEADLLVVPSGMPGGAGPVLSPSLDWLYQVIPCNLWVIRGKS